MTRLGLLASVLLAGCGDDSAGSDATSPLPVQEPPSEPSPTELLPDLLTWAPFLRDAHVSREDGRRLLRFSNAAADRGAGPLELFGQVSADGTTEAWQVVYHSVGTFAFAGHESHNHWHFEDFSRYELRRRRTRARTRGSPWAGPTGTGPAWRGSTS